MHFALPPRKTSQPPSYQRTSRLPGLRRSRLKLIALIGLAFLTLLYIATRPRSSSGHAPSTRRAPRGTPPVVLVTVLDHSRFNGAYLDMVRENRIKYAEKHGMFCSPSHLSRRRIHCPTHTDTHTDRKRNAHTGYQTLLAQVGDYDLQAAPFTWTAVVAMRDALTKYPDCRYIWFLDASGLVMNPKLTIEEHLMAPARLEALMRRDVSVVPPDSIIKTFKSLKAEEVDLVVTQDKAGISAGSVVVRNGEWARFFLETWFDPLYRSYNFQKAEAHALVGWLSFSNIAFSSLRGFANAVFRNTLCSGTRPSSRAWPSSTSACSMLTTRGPRRSSTRTATLSSAFLTVRRPGSGRARPSLRRMRRPGGGCFRLLCEGWSRTAWGLDQGGWLWEHFDRGVGRRRAFGHGFRHT